MRDTTAPIARRPLEMRQGTRRPLAVLAILGYPIAVLALTQLPALGIPAPLAAVVAAFVLVPALWAMWRVYEFRGRLAQSPDDELDERQVRVRDRAYLEAYRLFVLMVLLALMSVAILPDILDTPITLDYVTLQWFIMGAILTSLTLPSAVVAWGEPDLPADA